MLKMKSLEDKFRNSEEFKTFCYAEIGGDGACHSKESYISILDLFEDFDLEKATNSEIRDHLMKQLQDEEKAKRYKYLIDFEVDSNKTHIQFLRSKVNLGLPLNVNGQTFKNEYDRIDE